METWEEAKEEIRVLERERDELKQRLERSEAKRKEAHEEAWLARYQLDEVRAQFEKLKPLLAEVQKENEEHATDEAMVDRLKTNLRAAQDEIERLRAYIDHGVEDDDLELRRAALRHLPKVRGRIPVVWNASVANHEARSRRFALEAHLLNRAKEVLRTDILRNLTLEPLQEKTFSSTVHLETHVAESVASLTVEIKTRY